MGPTLLLLTSLLLAQVAEPVGPSPEGTTEAGVGRSSETCIGCFFCRDRPAELPAAVLQMPQQLKGSHGLVESLQRLVEAQGEDGLWGPDGAELRPTAWALLALQGAGHSHMAGWYRDQVRAAMKALYERQRVSERGGFCGPDAPLAERALTTRALLMGYANTEAYHLKRATGLAYGELLEAVAAAPVGEANAWVWSTLALIRAQGLEPRWPPGLVPPEPWSDAAINSVRLLERLAAWERDWSGSEGEVWDAARLAEHLPWLLTARLASLFAPVNQVDTRFLDAHPELASADFSGADAETLCWLAWVAGECDPPRFDGWRERLATELGPRLEALARDGDERQTALATMAWASLRQP